jgi:hypothetical protein
VCSIPQRSAAPGPRVLQHGHTVCPLLTLDSDEFSSRLSPTSPTSSQCDAILRSMALDASTSSMYIPCNRTSCRHQQGHLHHLQIQTDAAGQASSYVCPSSKRHPIATNCSLGKKLSVSMFPSCKRQFHAVVESFSEGSVEAMAATDICIRVDRFLFAGHIGQFKLTNRHLLLLIRLSISTHPAKIVQDEHHDLTMDYRTPLWKRQKEKEKL